MRWMLLTLLPLICVVCGCNSLDATRETDVSTPANEIDNNADKAKEHAKNIDDKKDVIEQEAKKRDIYPAFRNPLISIGKSTQAQIRLLDKISEKSAKIKAQQARIDDLRQRVEKANKRTQKVKTWLYTGLKIAGLIAVGIGLVIALRLNMMTGASISVAGIGITTAAQLWQLYWQWLVGGLAVLIVGVVGYSLYSVIVLKDAWWRDQNAVPKKKKHEKAKEKANKG